jgi:hypothetical protein
VSSFFLLTFILWKDVAFGLRNLKEVKFILSSFHRIMKMLHNLINFKFRCIFLEVLVLELLHLCRFCSAQLCIHFWNAHCYDNLSRIIDPKLNFTEHDMKTVSDKFSGSVREYLRPHDMNRLEAYVDNLADFCLVRFQMIIFFLNNFFRMNN